MEGRCGFSEGFPACHSIPTTFSREIPRKTFPTLVNKNSILYSIGVTFEFEEYNRLDDNFNATPSPAPAVKRKISPIAERVTRARKCKI